jgi:hypothetical protein
MAEVPHPIEGQVVLLAGAQASVTLTHLSDLLERVQHHVADSRAEYDREYERIPACGDADYYLTDQDRWDAIGRRLELEDREIDAVRRTHAEQFRRDGRRQDRREEFETALDIRDVVAIAPPNTG